MTRAARVPLVAWMLDLAREQWAVPEVLREILRASLAAGYNAIGLYLEHRFAYASAPWAAAEGALTPALVRELRGAGIRLIPFLNTLGHCEGFLRAEGGQHLAEGPHEGLGQQICASRPECAAFARGLIDDVLAAFDDPWLHLGGDETRQLGQCPRCAERVARIGPGGLYGEFFGPLCRYVLERGRRPGLWGDMLLRHPEALASLPPETLIFDWQYDHGPEESTAFFRRQGFDVVCCPSLQTYNSGWCFWPESRANIDAHAKAAAALGALGVLVTTWELCGFTSYTATLPLIYAAGRRLAYGTAWSSALETERGPDWAQAAERLGAELPALSPFLAPGTWRQLRDRVVLRLNPFYLWQDWRGEACGPIGDAILELCSAVLTKLNPDDPLHLPIELHRVSVQWVRLVERCYGHYRAGELPECRHALHWEGIPLLGRLTKPLQVAVRTGGSRADLVRLARLMDHVKLVGRRIEALLGSVGGFRPAFETLIHEGYIPGDQAAWRTSSYR